MQGPDPAAEARVQKTAHAGAPLEVIVNNGQYNKPEIMAAAHRSAALMRADCCRAAAARTGWIWPWVSADQQVRFGIAVVTRLSPGLSTVTLARKGIRSTSDKCERTGNFKIGSWNTW